MTSLQVSTVSMCVDVYLGMISRNVNGGLGCNIASSFHNLYVWRCISRNVNGDLRCDIVTSPQLSTVSMCVDVYLGM